MLPNKNNAIDLSVSGQFSKDSPERVDYELVFEEVPATLMEAQRAEWHSKLWKLPSAVMPL